MRFDLKKPCKACPFRTDRVGYLGVKRADEIAENLLSDDFNWFGCHETTVADENGDLHCGEETQHCLGAIMFLLNTVGLNVVTRVAVISGKLDLKNLDRSVPVVGSKQEFLDLHSAAD